MKESGKISQTSLKKWQTSVKKTQTYKKKWHTSEKKNTNYNHGHNIMKIFDVLPNFPFSTSETKPDYQ